MSSSFTIDFCRRQEICVGKSGWISQDTVKLNPAKFQIIDCEMSESCEYNRKLKTPPAVLTPVFKVNTMQNMA